MAGVYYSLVYMQTGQRWSNTHQARPTNAHRATVVLCSAAFTSGNVYTSHCLIFSRPKPGGGVCIYIYIWLGVSGFRAPPPQGWMVWAV